MLRCYLFASVYLFLINAQIAILSIEDYFLLLYLSLSSSSTLLMILTTYFMSTLSIYHMYDINILSLRTKLYNVFVV